MQVKMVDTHHILLLPVTVVFIVVTIIIIIIVHCLNSHHHCDMVIENGKPHEHRYQILCAAADKALT